MFNVYMPLDLLVLIHCVCVPVAEFITCVMQIVERVFFLSPVPLSHTILGTPNVCMFLFIREEDRQCNANKIFKLLENGMMDK